MQATFFSFFFFLFSSSFFFLFLYFSLSLAQSHGYGTTKKFPQKAMCQGGLAGKKKVIRRREAFDGIFLLLADKPEETIIITGLAQKDSGPSCRSLFRELCIVGANCERIVKQMGKEKGKGAVSPAHSYVVFCILEKGTYLLPLALSWPLIYEHLPIVKLGPGSSFLFVFHNVVSYTSFLSAVLGSNCSLLCTINYV